MHLGYTTLFMAALVFCGCAGGGGSSGGSSEPVDIPHTRTVCVAADSTDLLPHVERAVDAWNEAYTGPLSRTCTEHTRCLPKVVAHELGHALGIHHHTPAGLMQANDAHRSDVTGITQSDLAELPHDAPILLVTDAPCDHEVGWGYPSEPVLAAEVAWYEIRTGKIWIDPGVTWKY